MKTLMRNGRDRRSENPFLGHARKERVSLFGTDQRITSGPAATRLHSKAEYMTAPERFADSQIPLAPRPPSIHDPMRTFTVSESRGHRFESRRARQSAPEYAAGASAPVPALSLSPLLQRRAGLQRRSPVAELTWNPETAVHLVIPRLSGAAAATAFTRGVQARIPIAGR